MSRSGRRSKTNVSLASGISLGESPWDTKGDFIDQEVDSPAAAALLAALPDETRALLAQAIAMHLVREAPLPPLSVPPALAHVAEPLLAAGWLEPCDDEQYLAYGDEWGPVPVGWCGVALSWKGIAAVLALLSGVPEMGSDWVGRKPSTLRRYARRTPVRRFRVRHGIRWRTLSFPTPSASDHVVD